MGESFFELGQNNLISAQNPWCDRCRPSLHLVHLYAFHIVPYVVTIRYSYTQDALNQSVSVDFSYTFVQYVIYDIYKG